MKREDKETLAVEAKKLLAAMINAGRESGKLEEVLANMQPKAKEVVTLMRYAGIPEKPTAPSGELQVALPPPPPPLPPGGLPCERGPPPPPPRPTDGGVAQPAQGSRRSSSRP